jgi:hypothetical protein
MMGEVLIAAPILVVGGATAIYGIRRGSMRPTSTLLYAAAGYYGSRGANGLTNVAINYIDGMSLEEGLLNVDNKRLHEQWDGSGLRSGRYRGAVESLYEEFTIHNRRGAVGVAGTLGSFVLWEVHDRWLPPLLRNRQKMMQGEDADHEGIVNLQSLQSLAPVVQIMSALAFTGAFVGGVPLFALSSGWLGGNDSAVCRGIL